ncbi:MAG TPA: hypothetical protein VLA88_02795, partial [Candidatus Saccharimonadales bacterium]|nr:hypothetical protein [Candidatus Saccharimonadales bacterium]
MEHNLPPVVELTPPTNPEAPKKKARWNIFDVFKRVESESVPPSDRAAETQTHRKFGASIIGLFRGETGLSETPVSSEEARPQRGDWQLARSATLEQSIEPSIMERAQEMGRGVLRLVRKVKADVAAADQQERVAKLTDTQPLVEADEQVRAAMEALIAPIEAYAAERGITPLTTEPVTPPELATPEMSVDYAPNAGHYLPPQHRSASALEIAAAIAADTSEAVIGSVPERAAARHQRL